MYISSYMRKALFFRRLFVTGRASCVSYHRRWSGGCDESIATTTLNAATPKDPRVLLGEGRTCENEDEHVLQHRFEACSNFEDVLSAVEILAAHPPNLVRPRTLATAWHRFAKFTFGVSRYHTSYISSATVSRLLRATRAAVRRGEVDSVVALDSCSHTTLEVSRASAAGLTFAAFCPREIVAVLWAWGKLRLRDQDDLLEAISIDALKQIHHFQGKDFATALYSLGLLQGCDTVVPAKDFTSRSSKDISSTSLAESVTKTTSSSAVVSLVGALCAHAPKKLMEFRQQEVSNIVYGLSLLRYVGDGSLLRALCRRAANRIDLAGEMDISIMVYSLGLLRYRHTKFLNAACTSAAERLSEFKPQGLSNTIYGLGVLGFRVEGFLEALCSHLPKRIQTFTPQGVANTIYALGLLDFADHIVLDTICSYVTQRLDDFSPQQVANVVYALGRLSYTDLALLQEVAKHMVSERVGLRAFKAQELSNVVYAFGLLRFAADTMLQSLSDELPSRLEEFNAQNISNTVYAFGLLNYRNEALMKAVCSHIPDRLEFFTAQGIANFVWALGVLYFRHETLLKAVCSSLPRRLDEFDEQNISNTVMGLGKLSYCDAPALRALAHGVPVRIGEFKASGIATLAHGLVLLCGPRRHASAGSSPH